VNIMESIFEKLGIFYLGRELNPDTMEATETPTLVKSKNFTTHAAIIGMTGSGKTGLGIDLLEEAAIDNIPVIAIDPKGDMGNLCLAFPDLSPDDFLPWVEEEAHEKGVEPMEVARKTARMWREGIESFDQTPERIRRFKEHDVTIYTPGSTAGVPVSVLGSLAAPDAAVLEEADAFAQSVNTTVASLLSLLGIEADPLESREFILLAQILKRAWMAGEGLDMGTLISRIVTPPFDRIGVLPLESFYPPSDRFKLASRFNNVLASPTFENWLKGDPLDIDRLMYDENQRSKISIFSIAHLSDRERMFFVTLLLNAVLGWMRRQSGTGRLRALVYMDEIYGYFPPSKNPPSKEPMMLLLKQARAFGVGMVLSTQNPVDLDYKGLSNIGTWFIGRLQTKQDIAKVIEGLSGKVAGTLSKERIARLLATLPKRTFFLKSAHVEKVHIFRTRWVLSYLAGPLKRRDISRLMAKKKAAAAPEAAPEAPAAPKAPLGGAATESAEAPILPRTILQRFEPPFSSPPRYTPSLAAKGRVRYFNAARGIDIEEPWCLILPLSADVREPSWEEVQACEEDFSGAPTKPASGAAFAPLPPFLTAAKSLKPFEKTLKALLYGKKRLELYRCRPLKAESRPGESLEAFKNRLMEILEEKREAESEKLQERYEKRLKTLQERYEKALMKLEKEEQDVSATTTSSLIDTGLAVFGALFGSKRSAASKVGQALKGGRRVMKEKADVERARAQVAAVEEKIEAMKEEMEEKLDALYDKYLLENYEIETFFIKPRKSDIAVDRLVLYWKADV
jgi:hypothetical protein